jgi:hypothetical protein
MKKTEEIIAEEQRMEFGKTAGLDFTKEQLAEDDGRTQCWRV